MSVNKKQTAVSFDTEWTRIFNELCYEVFFKNEKGRQLLNHLELKYFRSPTAIPGQDSSWAYFNEGQREIIRLFTQAIQAHMNQPAKTDEQGQVNRETK